MRRKDRQRDEAFAWEVFRRAPYATVSLVNAEGRPYGVPVNTVVDDAYHVLYFHCAGAGEKWEALKNHPEVSVSAVSRAAILPGKYETTFDSAILRGRAEVVTDEGERVKALLLLVETLDPKHTDRLNECMQRCLEATKVVKIIPQSLTGKQHGTPQADPTSHGCR